MISFVTCILYFHHCYRNGIKLEPRTLSIQIIIVSVSTVILILLRNSLSRESSHHNTKIYSILNKYWIDRDYGYDSYFWDNLQSIYKCCGVNNCSDWESEVPESCYQNRSDWMIRLRRSSCNFAYRM